MPKAFAYRVGALFRLGKNEGTLQNGLNKIADAFCTPGRARCVSFLGRLNIQDQQSPILLVPNVAFEIERNALINPAHSEAQRIRVVSI